VAKPYNVRSYPIPQIHKATLIKELNRLASIGLLKRQSSLQWASLTFIIPKKDMIVWTISEFRELNKRIVRQPYPIPNISTILQELEGFTYAIALDLNMGYYTIILDPMTVKMCIILVFEITNWNEWFCRHLPGRNDGPDGSPRVSASIH
jgi:hypothetical protein